MLLFARAAPAGSRLVPLRVRSTDGLRVWATIDARHVLRVVAINPSATERRVLALRGTSGRATLALLRAPGLGARAGATLAGQVIGDDGRLHGRVRVQRLAATAAGLRVVLPPASAGLVTVRRPGASA